MLLVGADPGELAQARAVLSLQHDELREGTHQAAEKGGGQEYACGLRIILKGNRHIRAERLKHAGIIFVQRIVAAKAHRRRDQDSGRAGIHRGPGERPYVRKGRVADPHNDRNAAAKHAEDMSW